MKCKTVTMMVMLVASAYLCFSQAVTVEPNTNIKVESGTTLDISGGNLVLESDASGDASLIDYGSVTYTGGGEAKVERYLTEGQWHLVSSPVANALSGMFQNDYLQYHTESSNDWTDIYADDYSMGIMQGYSLWSVEVSPTTEVFSGITNTGILNKGFTESGLGWNLVGNPYPSTLDWDAVTIPGELNGAIYLFDPTNGANGNYVYYIKNGGGANTTTQYIPSGQGFFVRATTGAGTLSFDNNDRVHGGQAFYKNTENELLVLKITGNNITTQTAIRFNENSTQGADRLFDVYKIMSDSPDVPMLFTKVENENMAINTLPSIRTDEVVSMWFRAGIDGEYTINATEIETFDSETPIYLYDFEAEIIQNLRQNLEYVFDYKSGSDRSFLVYFTEPDNSTFKSEINIYAYDNILHVNFPVSELVNTNFTAQIMVFDLTGKMVFQTVTTKIENQLPIKANNSIYMVKVISGSEVANGKVFIK